MILFPKCVSKIHNLVVFGNLKRPFYKKGWIGASINYTLKGMRVELSIMVAKSSESKVKIDMLNNSIDWMLLLVSNHCIFQKGGTSGWDR